MYPKYDDEHSDGATKILRLRNDGDKDDKCDVRQFVLPTGDGD